MGITKYLRLKVNVEILGQVISLVGILIGFIITSITNLFGRDVTKIMIKTQNAPKKGQKQKNELEEVLSEMRTFIKISLVIIFISISALLVSKSEFWNNYNDTLRDCLTVYFTGIYIFIIINLILIIKYYFDVMINLLMNETKRSL